MLIKEYRIIMPMTVNEYQIGQLWSVAVASKHETGGGEGVEVLANEPFDSEINSPPNPLIGNGIQFTTGQYTFKRFYLVHKVPTLVRMVAPKGSLEIEEHAWNAFPYCRTVLDNPKFMKENFTLCIESMHIQDEVNLENVHALSPEQLAKREVIYIDIVNDEVYTSSDYKAETDPKLFQSVKTGRGPLVGKEWWKNSNTPIMCAYKLVTCEFKWWGLQTQIEALIQRQERRIFLNFNRQVYCWIDKWCDLCMGDIRKIEGQTKEELDKQRHDGEIRGTVMND